MRKLIFASLLALAAGPACKSNPDKPDNTGQNAQQKIVEPTADEAVKNATDLDLTQKIRKAIVDDGSLSTNAHNCKVIVRNGQVTLVGPVASAAEKTKIEQLATAIVGDRTRVSNQLEATN